MKSESTPLADIGIVGLAVMGQNLALNINDHGFIPVVFNRTTAIADEFMSTSAKGTKIIGTKSLSELVRLLKRPRRVMLMVKAGEPIDDTIEALLPLLETGDVIIDGGNTLFTDTMRREKYVASKGILYIGTGVSGGEEGARHGPSIMPGGSSAAWPLVKDILQGIAAKVDGSPCCEWVGPDGAGHYVKMVHNGIEYGDMQLIAETYQMLKIYLGLNADEMSAVFAQWNKSDLDSYLVQITAEILAFKDTDGLPLIDKILDTAGQKGTGKWTVINSANLGQPVTLIAEAVFARSLSALKDERLLAAQKLNGPKPEPVNDKETFIEQLRQALYGAKIVSYAQGFMLMRAAASEYGWNLNYGNIAMMWRGGCIIRSRFLGKIKEAFDNDPKLMNLLVDPFFSKSIMNCQQSWRNVVAAAAQAGVPLPAHSSALSFYDGYRSQTLPANLLQAQRDYFGAHTYERVDKPQGEYYHTNWTGHGGTTSSTSYIA
jgi:6-phosphogluconate dehydrogenase